MSHTLAEEGAAILSFKLVKGGVFQVNSSKSVKSPWTCCMHMFSIAVGSRALNVADTMLAVYTAVAVLAFPVTVIVSATATSVLCAYDCVRQLYHRRSSSLCVTPCTRP